MDINIADLTKRYKSGLSPALNQASFSVERGVFGLLGPNGAGKTTLMKILATLLSPSSGDVLLDGKSIISAPKIMREVLGYLPQDFSVHPSLKVWEFLDYVGTLKRMEINRKRDETNRVLEQVGLAEVRNRRVRKLSGGMMRRLGVAQALLGDPRVLIVDEPTVGLDPEERVRFRNLISEAGHSETIVLSTHIVGDISSTCSRLAILNQGSVIFQGSPAELIRLARGKVWELTVAESEYEKLRRSLHVVATVLREGKLHLRIVDSVPPELTAVPVEPSLEDAYVSYMLEKTGKYETTNSHE